MREYWLSCVKSLIPLAPPSLLAKKTSSVAGTHIGASCAKAKLSFCAMSVRDGFDPSTSRNSFEKIWIMGSVLDVGLKSCDELRNVPFKPSTAKDRGSMS